MRMLSDSENIEIGERLKTRYGDYGTVVRHDDKDDGDRTYWLGDLRDFRGHKIPGLTMRVKHHHIDEKVGPGNEPPRAD